MTDITPLIDGYLAAWNETDAARRRELIASTWTDDARYVDPLAEGRGRDGIDAVIAGVQQQFPGHRFELAGAPDAHHDVVRFTWHLKGDGGHVATGTDVATVVDGRLREVTGFLEPVA